MEPVTSFDSIDLNKLYNYADYYSWKFKERVELIKGRVFKMSPSPNRRHQEISVELTFQMYSFFKGHACKIYEAPFDVRLPIKNRTSDQTETVVQPDLCVVCDLDKLDDRGCFGAPDLIVEILSPGNSKKEMKNKYEVYEEAGVKEYWILNPLEKNALIYTLNDQGKFIGQKPVIEDEPLVSYTFPKLKVDLKEVFKD